MQQLDSNLAALDLPLSTDHIDRLDRLSEPKLNFSCSVPEDCSQLLECWCNGERDRVNAHAVCSEGH